MNLSANAQATLLLTSDFSRAAAMSLSSFCVVTNALRLNLRDIHSAKHDRKHRNSAGAQSAESAEFIGKEANAMEKTLKIDGMMCPHCEAHVKQALETIPQVTSADVSHTAGTAVVHLNAAVSDDVLKQAVEEAGYSVK